MEPIAQTRPVIGPLDAAWEITAVTDASSIASQIAICPPTSAASALKDASSRPAKVRDAPSAAN